MDWQRVVEVFEPASGRRGSGYLLASGLALTARHVVGDAPVGGGPASIVQLRRLEPDADGLPGAVGPWLDAQVVWRGGDTLDAALLAPAAPPAVFRAALAPVFLGRPDGRATVPVDALGFPRAVGTATHSDTLHLRAALDPLSLVRAEAWLLQELAPRPAVAEQWRGMSGAAVFAGDRLVGLIEAVPENFAASSLRAVPASAVAETPAAREVLAAAGIDGHAVSVDAGYVAALPRSGHWEDLRAAYTRAVVTNFCRLDRAGIAIGGDDEDRLPALQAFAAQRLTRESGPAASEIRAEKLAGEPRAVVLGSGGAGKSTVLKQTLARAAAALPSLVPVWLPLAQLPREGPLTLARLLDHLVEQAHTLLGLTEVSAEFFSAILAGGQALIACDALDEAGSLPRGKEVANLIREMAAQWPKCRIVVSSRPEAFRQAPLPAGSGAPGRGGAGFARYQLEPFGRADIAPFLTGAFPDGEALAKNILERTGIEALLGTPLTLTLVALAIRANAALPATRTELFQLCFDTVCATWDEAKGGASADGLLPPQRLEALRCLGWEAQVSGEEMLEEATARTALGRSVEAFTPAQVRQILGQLGRRSLVLRTEHGPGGVLDLRRVGFAHPQFREYLAGAQLAERFAGDPAALAKEMASRWLDARWLEVLRFATGSLNAQPKVRDALLRLVLEAPDPYRDLIHRPEFVAAALLERPLPGVDAAIVRRVVGCLEQVIHHERALLDPAARAIVSLAAHPAAHGAVAALARGTGIGAVLAAADASPAEFPAPRFEIRLAALRALARIEGPAAALRELEKIHGWLGDGLVAWAALRVELGDRLRGLALLRGWVEDAGSGDPPFPMRALAVLALDRIGETETLNRWLRELLAGPRGNEIAFLQLAHERGLLADDAPEWPRLFDAATRIFETLPSDCHEAPHEARQAVYFVHQFFRTAAPPAAQRLLQAALLHPSMMWYVAPHMGQLAPGSGAAAMDAMMRFITESGPAVDFSRINIVIAGVAREPEDDVAVPALLRILRVASGLSRRINLRPVFISLGRRERGAEVLEMLRPMLETPAARLPPDEAELRRQMLDFATRVVPEAVFALLDRIYRSSGDPAKETRYLAETWETSGLDAGAVPWFCALAATEAGRAWLDCLGREVPEGAWTQALQVALGHPSEVSTAADSLSLEQVERSLADAMAQRDFAEEWDRQMNDRFVGETLAKLHALAGDEPPRRAATAWLRTALSGDPAAAFVDAHILHGRLETLAANKLLDRAGIDFTAQAARRMQPKDRVKLIHWLRENA